MVKSVNIGDKAIHVTAYNPSDALSLLYCRYVVERAHELLDNTSVEDVHRWLREHVPGCAELLDRIEAGDELVREVPIGSYPVTPGQEEFELPIIGRLKMERMRQGAFT